MSVEGVGSKDRRKPVRGHRCVSTKNIKQVLNVNTSSFLKGKFFFSGFFQNMNYMMSNLSFFILEFIKFLMIIVFLCSMIRTQWFLLLFITLIVDFLYFIDNTLQISLPSI